MPLIEVTIVEGREPARISEMARRVTDTVAETLDAPRAAIRVIVREVPATHWFVAGQSKESTGDKS